MTGTPGRLASTILPFQLPLIPEGEQIVSATLRVTSIDQASANDPRADQNVDLYGLPFDEEADVDITSSRHYSGPDDTTAGVVKLQDNFLTPAIGQGVTQDVTSVDISAYIIGLYGAGGADDGDFAILRLSDDNPSTSVLRRYVVASAGTGSTTEATFDANAAIRPLLTITTAPVPSQRASV